ncbi:hypothetical protein V5O48_007325 [Marasmius crinis-equi]|uniref:Dienelactone hydrolase domain-containing protein n=1 Tax=Marasmius crinis-equi TaxID=585013 RepID=A0ABR3FHJ0_9AGAR
MEIYASQSRAPLMINSCTDDSWFPPAAGLKTDAILGGEKFSPGYRRQHFEGLSHGFAVRGDMSNPTIREAKEKAFSAAVEWFKTRWFNPREAKM